MNTLIKHGELGSRFTQVSNVLIQGLGNLSDNAYRVFMVLKSMGGENCHPSVGGLSRMVYSRGSPKSQETIKRAIDELKKAGLLVIERTGYNAYTWRLMK